MFRIAQDPSSGSLVQCLTKNYKNDSVVSVDMDKAGVMAVYSDPLCVCVVQLTTHTHNAISPMLYFIIRVFFPFHVVLAANMSVKQTALVLSNYSHNMLP